MFLQLVVLYVDFKLDESYTPSKISIRAGDGFHNLKVFQILFLNWHGNFFHLVSSEILRKWKWLNVIMCFGIVSDTRDAFDLKCLKLRIVLLILVFDWWSIRLFWICEQFLFFRR